MKINFDIPITNATIIIEAGKKCISFEDINNESLIVSYTNRDLLKPVEGKIKICEKEKYTKDYQTEDCHNDTLFYAFYNEDFECIRIPKPEYLQSKNKCQLLTLSDDKSQFIFKEKECLSLCENLTCDILTGDCIKINDLKYESEIPDDKIVKCSEDFGFYLAPVDCEDTFDKISKYSHTLEKCEEIEKCQSEDLCSISFSSVFDSCLSMDLIEPLTKDPECFIYVCENGTLKKELLYFQFNDLCSSCVAKYGDLLNIGNGEVCYLHFQRYIKKMFDFMFIFVVICSVILSIIATITGNFIKIRRKKGYVQLLESQESKQIEMQETKPEEEEVSTD